MIITNKNKGTKISYSVEGERITFNDDLTINLVKRQQDYPVHIDVCFDANKALVIGAAAGRSYVAEIDIPAKEYILVEQENSVIEELELGVPEALPLDMEKVTLTLWNVNEVE